MPLTRTVPRGRRTTRPGASTTLRRPPSRRRRWARFRKGQALKTIRRRDSPRRLAASLSPLQSALEAALERLVARGDQPNPLGAGDWRAARAAIAAFYAARDFQPVWVGDDGLTEAGRAALSQLERAGDDGLDLSQFALPRGIGPGLAADALAEAETTIASAVVTYAEQASGSRVAPSRLWPLLRATPSVAEPAAALAETAAAADPARLLADFNPPQKGYRELREELKRLTEDAPGRAGAHGGKPVDPQADRAAGG